MNRLEDTYQKHHAEGNRYGFTFGGAERINRFREWAGTGKTILDLGCRDGILTSAISGGNRIIGADIDRRALSAGKTTQRLNRVAQVDLTRPLPFASQAFDLVQCGEVLEHLPDPPRVLEEIHRVLLPNGVFTGSVPNAFRLKNRLLFLTGKDFEKDPTHLHHFSCRSLYGLLEQYFQSIEILPLIGRFTWLYPSLFANVLFWRATRK